jgi:hypothetical protein
MQDLNLAAPKFDQYSYTHPKIPWHLEEPICKPQNTVPTTDSNFRITELCIFWVDDSNT